MFYSTLISHISPKLLRANQQCNILYCLCYINLPCKNVKLIKYAIRKNAKRIITVDMILKTIYLILYARFVNPSMNICIVTDADSPNNNEVRKMQRSGHFCLRDDKMIQVNESTSQPIKQENKKCVLSYLIISSKDQEGYRSSGLPINLCKN